MKYQVKDPQGQTHIIDGPDGATPDEIIAQAQKLIPQKTDWKGVVGSAMKNAFVKPGSFTRDLLTNPETMAKALPPLAGMAGAVSPIPGGATMGTVGGRQLSNAMLRLLGKKDQIPSGMSQVAEGSLAALGDLGAIPAIKGRIFGKQIGEAENAAGVITRAPTKAVTPGSVGETLNNLEAQIDAGTINTPQGARDAKAVVNQIYKNPKIYEQTSDISVQAQRVSKKVQDLVNKVIKGRAEPAAQMARAMTIPRMVGNAYKAIPQPIKQSLGIAGAAGIGGLSWEMIKKLLGDSR